MTAPSPDRSLWLGDFHPDLESAFTERLRALAPGGDARNLLVVVPNRLLAAHLRRRAAELGAPTYGLEPRSLEDLIADLAAPVLRAAGVREIPAGFLAAALEHLLRGERRKTFASPGMVRALTATVRDLRDAGVEPDALQAAVESELGGAARPREAARLYGRYTQELGKRRLADAATRTAAALAALDGAAGDELPGRVIVYGIYDLVGRQRSFLARLLGGRAADVFFPWRPGRAFEYADELRRWFTGLGFEAVAPKAVMGSDRLSHLRRYLFAEDAAPGPAADGSVRLLSAPAPARELAELRREDLAARAAGTTGTTGILVRRADDAVRDAVALERRSGLRFHLPAGETWRRRPAGAASSVLLRIAAGLRGEDGGPSLERGRVEELLGTGGLARELFPPGSRPARWTQALRRRGLLGRVDAWERLVTEHRGGQLALGLDQPPPAPFAPSGDEERDPRLRRELPAIAVFVERLLADGRRLGDTAGGWRGVSSRWREVLRRWLEPGEDAEGWLEALATLERLEGVLPARWAQVESALGSLLDGSAPGHGRLGDEPTVADLLAVRGVTFDHLAMPRLVERAVPRRPREDAVLLDDERMALNRRLPASAQLPLKVEPAIAEERMLFRLAVGSARRSLLLSWPRRDAEGRRLVPSAYLLAVTRALTGRDTGFEALTQDAPAEAEWLELREVALEPGAPEDRPLLHDGERDLREIARALRGERAPLGWLRAAHPGIEASLRAQLARSGFRDRGRLTLWDGLADSSLGAAWLAARRAEAPAATAGALPLSASALETYVRCSFQFFNRYVLRLESEPPSETRLELDALESGALYHELLAELFQRLDREGLLPLDPNRLDAARATLAELFEELRRQPPWIAHEMPPALWALWRERAAADFGVLLEHEAASPGWRPLLFELPFGGADSAVAIEVGGQRLAPRGAIDRLDVRPGGGGVRVVDYKTGKLKVEHTPEPPALKGRLQAPLYARVVEALRASGQLGDAAGPISALYLGVQSGSGYRRVEWTPEALEAAAPELERVLAAIAGGVGAGEFFQVERGFLCALCEFSDICGPARQSRLAAKAADERVTRAAAWRGETT